MNHCVINRFSKQVWEGMWDTRQVSLASGVFGEEFEQDCLSSLCTHFDLSHVSSPTRHMQWLFERTTGTPQVELGRCHVIATDQKGLSEEEDSSDEFDADVIPQSPVEDQSRASQPAKSGQAVKAAKKVDDTI